MDIERIVNHTIDVFDGESNPKARDLLMGTIAVESDFGKHRRQLGLPYEPDAALLGGWGIVQMEAPTAEDIFRTYLSRRPGLWKKLCYIWFGTKNVSFFTPSMRNLALNLRNDDYFAVAMMRVHYWRVPVVLPDTFDEIAHYWKTFYNTELGAGTPEKFIGKSLEYFEPLTPRIDAV